MKNNYNPNLFISKFITSILYSLRVVIESIGYLGEFEKSYRYLL
jgi:hypothetical protein